MALSLLLPHRGGAAWPFAAVGRVSGNPASSAARGRFLDGGRGLARPGWDYVLVGRPGATVERGFADLRADLAAALARVHGA